MKPTYTYLLPLLIILIISSCNPGGPTPPSLRGPEVTTLPYSPGANGGIILNGRVNPGSDSITEYGFEFAWDSMMTSNKQTFVSTGTAINGNDYNYFIGTGIDSNTTYYYQAYVEANASLYYGEVESFVSNGNSGPVIDSISPTFGHLGDSLTIYGEYFTNGINPTIVRFSNSNTIVPQLFQSDSLIVCIVPYNLRTVISDIIVSVGNKAGSYSSFQLYAPTISSVIPLQGVIGDTVTLIGKHFDRMINRNSVFLGNIRASVISSARDTVRIVVPSDIESPSETLKLTAQLQEATFPQNFSLSPPEILSISPLQATFREEITIIGNNFDREISRNKVYFGNIEASITYADRNTLKVLVPDDLESSQEPIKVQSQLQEDIFPQNFSLTPPEISFVQQNIRAGQDLQIQGSFFHPIFNKNIITIENIGTRTSGGNTTDLMTKVPTGPFPRRRASVKVQVLDLIATYSIDLELIDSWVMVEDTLPFRYHRYLNNAVVANNEAYVISYATDFNDQNLYLWKFDPSDYSWTAQSILPFSVRNNGSATSNGDNIYVYNSDTTHNFWEYNPLTNQWTEKAEYMGTRRDAPTHFSINGEIYVGMGGDFWLSANDPYADFFKYSPSTNTWSQIASYSYQTYWSRAGTVTFVLNGIAYMGSGSRNTGMKDYWSYDPALDQWIRIADFQDARSYPAAFAINGYGYVTGGTPIGSSQSKECWRYNPQSNIWELVEDIIIRRANHFSFSLNGKGYIGGGTILVGGGTSGTEFFEFIP